MEGGRIASLLDFIKKEKLDSRRNKIEIENDQERIVITYNVPEMIPIGLAAKIYDCSEEHFRNLNKRHGNILVSDGEKGKRGKSFVDKQVYYNAMRPL